MALIEENLIEELITEYGSDATWRQVASSTYDKFGEPTITFNSDVAIKVIVNDMGGKTKLAQEGLFNPNSKSYFVKSSIIMTRGDYIIHRDITYRVDNILDAELENFIHVHEVFVERLI